MPHFSEAVLEQVQSANQPAQIHYLLVDCAAIPGARLPKIWRHSSTALDVLTLAPPDWRETASPVLIALPDFDDAQIATWRTFARDWHQANAVCVLSSPLAPTELAASLNARTEAVLPDDYPVLLRYFDTRILASLMRVLTESQRKQLLAVATHWVYADRYGQAVILQGAQHPVAEDPLPPPFVLDAAQESALLAAAEPDALIDLLLEQRNPSLMEMTPPQQHQSISALLHHARSFGIGASTEQAAYCTLGLALGLDFHTQGAWPLALDQVKSGQRGLMEIMEQLLTESK